MKEQIQTAADELKDLIELFDMSCEISGELSIGDNNKRKYIILNVEGDDLGLLIGFQGTSLRAIEQYIGLLINKKRREANPEAERIRLKIDINNYKKGREENVRNIAIQAIDQVKESGQPIELLPMSPAERRIVHMVVKEEGGVSSQSDGNEGNRYVIINPE